MLGWLGLDGLLVYQSFPVEEYDTMQIMHGWFFNTQRENPFNFHINNENATYKKL